MILVLWLGSILLKSSGGSAGMGSPQYMQVLASRALGIPHVWQTTWSEFSFLFTGLGLKHMAGSFPSHARSSGFATGAYQFVCFFVSCLIIRTSCFFVPSIFGSLLLLAISSLEGKPRRFSSGTVRSGQEVVSARGLIVAACRPAGVR